MSGGGYANQAKQTQSGRVRVVQHFRGATPSLVAAHTRGKPKRNRDELAAGVDAGLAPRVDNTASTPPAFVRGRRARHHQPPPGHPGHPGYQTQHGAPL